MNKLAYALIASTALVVTSFAPNRADRFAACGAFLIFAVFTVTAPYKKDE